MVTKAIVEEVVDNNHIRVRIPIYNKAADDSSATPTKQLTEAGVNTLPGIKSHYTKGDVVIVGFEENQVDKPMILGLLQSDKETAATTDITTDSLTVNVSYQFPTETSVVKQGGSGNSSAAIGNASINQAILTIQQRLTILEKKLDYSVGDIYLTTRDESPTDSLYTGTWVEAANSFALEFDDQIVPVYIWKKTGE